MSCLRTGADIVTRGGDRGGHGRPRVMLDQVVRTYSLERSDAQKLSAYAGGLGISKSEAIRRLIREATKWTTKKQS